MLRNEYYESAFKLSRYPATRYPLGENGEGMSLLTAFNAGDIVPLLAEPVFPNDKWDVNLSFLLRMFTPLHQIFSNIYFDTYVFWCNNRLNWTHWAQFCGQNDNEAFTLSFEYTIPKSEFLMSVSDEDNPQYGTDFVKSFASYLGINPTYKLNKQGGGANIKALVNDYFRRDYLNIYNEWFRSETVIDPILYSKGDTTEANPTFTYASPLLKAAKFHDYFTDSLPEPMRGPEPVIDNMMPVVPDGTTLHKGTSKIMLGDNGVGYNGAVYGYTEGGKDGALGLDSSTGTIIHGLDSSNLFAKANITIDDIRNSALIKHVLETLTASGTRYPEFLNGLWDASSPEVVLQIPEYVAGRRWRINISEVVSNANTVTESAGSPIGATGAMSKTGNSGFLFRKAFSEYGHIYVLGVVRIKQTYFQGIDRKFTDESFWELPLPQLAGLPYQPRYKRELYAIGSSDSDGKLDDAIFGYGPAFDQYRRFPDKAVGIMRPDGYLGLKHWNASEIYSDQVSLGQSFIEQPASGLDRCIAVPSEVRGAFQFYGEFLFTGSVTRTLPSGIPGITRL